MELSHFGAKVLFHPIQPVLKKIPIHIKNTFEKRKARIFQTLLFLTVSL
jgi:aspartokinase